MPLDPTTKFTNLLVSGLILLAGLLISTIGIIYNLFSKNINSLWDSDKKNKENIQENSKDVATINARCEERKK